MNMMTPQLLDWLLSLLRDGKVKEFYWTKEWRIIRKLRRRLDNNECQRCKRLGKYTAAEMVHHKEEVRHRPERALELANTECLCNSCHNKEHLEKLSKHTVRKFDNQERW